MTEIRTPGPVVVGLDGSTSAMEAARWAAREATLSTVPLRLVATFVWPTSRNVAALPAGSRTHQVVAGHARSWVENARSELAAHYPELPIETAVVEQEPKTTLIEESRSARTVVVGSRGLGGFTELLVGSVALSLVQHGHCPVVVVRGRTLSTPAPTDGPVVVGLDGSAGSSPALEFALRAASVRNVPLTAVHTWSDLPLENIDVRPCQEELEAEAELVLGEQLAGWQEKYPDVEIRRVVTMDRPVRSLLGHSEDAQLLVVGSRGRGGFTGMLLGSTSQALVHHGTCPLAVVRPEENR